MSTHTSSDSAVYHNAFLRKISWLLIAVFALVSCRTASLYHTDAAQAARSGNYQQAVELVTQAIIADSSSSETWNNRGVWHTHLGNYHQALADFTMAVALEPSHPTAYRNRIQAWLVLQQPDSAIADYSRLLELNPYYLNGQLARAALYNDIGKYQKAIDDYDIILAFDNNYYWAYTGRATAYKNLHKYNNAIGDCNTAVHTVLQLMEDIQHTGANRYWNPQWQPNTPQETIHRAQQQVLFTYRVSLSQLFAHRADMYADMDSLDRAIQDYHTALVWDSTNATAYGNMGWRYYQKNDFTTCLRLSELAVRHDGTALYARFNRALALLRLGNMEEARTAYGETLDYSAFLLQEESDSDSVRVSPLRAAAIERTRQGAIGDLRDMVEHNIQIEEAQAILREFFSAPQQQKTP